MSLVDEETTWHNVALISESSGGRQSKVTTTVKYLEKNTMKYIKEDRYEIERERAMKWKRDFLPTRNLIFLFRLLNKYLLIIIIRVVVGGGHFQGKEENRKKEKEERKKERAKEINRKNK